MLSRFFLLYLLLILVPGISLAENANWNCRQNSKTKAWDCVGSAAAPQKQVQEAPASAPQTKVFKDEKPVEPPFRNPEISESVVPPGKNQALDVDFDHHQVTPPPAQKSAVVEQTPDKINPPIVEKTVNQPETVEEPIKSLPADEKPPVVADSEKPVAEPAISKPTVGYATKPNGWNCDTKGKDGNWNCQLTGADPKGEARIVESGARGMGLFDPTFDNSEENIFLALRDRLKNNPWGNCSIQLGTQKYFVPDKKLRETADTDMKANYTEIYDNEVGYYQGNVDIKRADQRASSNSANYDSVSQVVDLHGNVFYSEDELSLYTDTATLKLDKEEAKLRDTLFISPTTPIRGRAGVVYRDSNTLSRYKKVAYTSCEPGNQDWIVHASDLKMNKQDGTGSAKNAWVEFKGVPIFYSPYLSFPIDDRRKTGFLAPVFGNTGRGGFSFTTPFYWNIAENLDATLRPRYYTKRGVMLAGEFRYLTEMTKGQVAVEYLPNDDVVKQDRYLASIKNNTRFTQNIAANLDLNLVSDKEYFADLGNALSFPSFSHVRSSADASFVDQDFYLKGQLINYQTIDPRFTGRLKPYRRLPQVNFNYNHSFTDILDFPINTNLESEYVYFQHDDSEPGSADFNAFNAISKTNVKALASGHRFNIKPSISLPIKTASAYVTPKLSLQYTQYMLDNQPKDYSDSISRFTPIASIDSGLFLEKDVNLFGDSYQHTLEPRLFYLYIPRVNQEQIPIFDTSFYDFWYPALFRENRFNGTDRIQDANQVSLALTSRLIDSKTGFERLKLNIGQIFYFQDRDVTAPIVRVGSTFLESRKETSSFSPLVAELSSQINQHLLVETGLQWDPEHNEIVRGKAFLHFVNEPGEIINIGYTYRKNNLIRDTLASKSIPDLQGEIGYVTDENIPGRRQQVIDNSLNKLKNNEVILRSGDIIQTDMSFRWPIYDKWFAIGRWQYSLLYNQTSDAFVGLEKETCCWRFRIIGRRFVNNIAAAANSPIGEDTPYNSQTGIYFQIEFKGLTGLGEKLDDFFARSIYGYRRTDF